MLLPAGISARRLVCRIPMMLILCTGGTGCPGREAGVRGSNDADSLRQSTAPTVAASEPVGQSSAAALLPPDSGTGCPERGLWRACSVQRRLERAGLAVHRRDDPVRHNFLHVDGIVWQTSRAEIQVFLYASEADRVRDTAGIDTVAVAPRGQRIVWKEPALWVASGNLAAIIISLNDRQAERIALALGAGLPAGTVP